MLNEDIERRCRQLMPPWDPLRERRVLREIERSLERRQARRKTIRRFAVAASVLLIAAAPSVTYLVALEFGARRPTERPIAPVQVATSQLVPAPAQPAASFDVFESRRLADGTNLDLSRNARLDVLSDSKRSVEVAQSAGYVRYSVPPLPGRSFLVVARGVRVQVKGTRFVVGVNSDKVSVKVEKGLVQVAANSGEVELGVGDELSTWANDAVQLDASTPANGMPPARTSRAPAGSFPSADALLERADAERRSGDLAAAAATLRSVLGRYPDDRRAALAWFTLGKVERGRDRAADGATAFRTSFALAPDGPLGEDALAEEAAAWAAAGEPAEARATAEQYLRRFPNGTHAARMQHIVE
jgi:transmembrane sensor